MHSFKADTAKDPIAKHKICEAKPKPNSLGFSASNDGLYSSNAVTHGTAVPLVSKQFASSEDTVLDAYDATPFGNRE